MKKVIGAAGGVTLIELLITSTIVSIMLVGVINLIGRVYRDITASMLKNNSMTFASEKLDYFKNLSFDSLSVTDDSYLPMPYYNLKLSPKCYEKETVNGIDYEIYSWVQWAEENDGVLDGRKYSELSSTYDYNMKKVNVAIVYMSNGFEKVSKMSTYITKKDLDVKGSIIEGKILKDDGGNIKGAGLSSGAYIMLDGFPQYMRRIIDDDGHYKILDVAPGSYTLIARGAGLASTNYGSNPLVISSVPTTYRDINITCATVPSGKVSGYVYWMTPEPTPEPVPTVVEYCDETKTLFGTGAMTGKTTTWSYPTRISVFDGDFDSGCIHCSSNTYKDSANAVKLYSEFPDVAPIPNSGICNVYIKYKTNVIFDTSTIGFAFTNDSGAHWANDGANPSWTRTAPTPVATNIIPNVYMDVELANDITFLYDDWDWNKINSLGFCVSTYNFGNGNGNAEIDYIEIDVKYYVAEPTPTPKPTAVSTPSYPCVYEAYVASLDSLSLPGRTSNTDCLYEISGIDVASGYTSMVAFKERNSEGKSYYKRVDGVTVTAGTVTRQDIFLELAEDVPAIFGTVKDYATGAPVLGAKVVLNDYAGSNTYTSGGGSYFMSPVTEGFYTLSAVLSGYTTINPITFNWQKGITKAEPLLLQPVGSISGNITYEDGSPAEDVTVMLKDNSGGTAKYAKTDGTGYYIINNAWADTEFKLELSINEDEVAITYPQNKYYKPVVVSMGVTLPNKDFKIQKRYGTISGKVQVDGVDVKSGTVVLAYPDSMPTPSHAHDFVITSGDKDKKKHGGRGRINSPYWGGMTDGSGFFEISVPMGENYDLYAFYSFVSYTGKSSKPNKQLKNFYKIRQNVPPNSTGQDLTGILGSWTTY